MDLVLRTGDHAIFDTLFGVATVAAPIGLITGSSPVMLNGPSACVIGDENSVIVTATYHTPDFSNLLSGTGVLTIDSLATDQMAQRGASRRLAFLLRGTRFRARLQVVSPATGPGGTFDAPGRIYTGAGAFTTANTKVRTM